jgi:hypothetical protein
VDASRPQKKRTFEHSGPFWPQTTEKRGQARKVKAALVVTEL